MLQLLGDSNLETCSLFDELRSFDKRCFFFDLGHPLLNRIAESFVKVAGVLGLIIAVVCRQKFPLVPRKIVFQVLEVSLCAICAH
ncbi:outer envelope pore protein 16-2, chloroplastic-like [Senna tora]|uniref:Outer envelope pore protein 16-2, chloroplastic-like n=1 Tax=Senna tora TaxID=362788 RepID=A0A834WT46_9FABA|nr:outer envelope pore protein 16-2, chloroplastic-like [Senna tora]